MRRQETLAMSMVVALVLAFAWIAPVADGDNNGSCEECGDAAIPDPFGGPPTIQRICLDFGGYTGFSECYECNNCNNCIMMWRCYWPWE